MEIRPAGPDDLDTIGRVHARSRAAAYDGLVPAPALARVTPHSQAEVWRRRWAERREPTALLVAADDGQVVGFAQGDGVGDVAELTAIHLLPRHQGGGAGQALHDALLDRFATWGCSSADLWVLRGNERAQSFYRRNGWTHDGTTGEHDVGGAVVPILRYRRPVTSATTRR
jgi:GNAT superfamily N-acetyltransferase